MNRINFMSVLGGCLILGRVISRKDGWFVSPKEDDWRLHAVGKSRSGQHISRVASEQMGAAQVEMQGLELPDHIGVVGPMAGYKRGGID